LVGGVIGLANSNGINSITEGIETWIRRQHEGGSFKRGWIYRMVFNPILILLLKFSDWTDSFSHRGIKNGVRVGGALYFLMAWIYFIVVGFIFFIVLAIGWVVIMLTLRYLKTKWIIANGSI
jgi:hypothetical protein